jgi:hypothetical protein
MLWEYIKEVVYASWEFSKGGGEVIEVLIALAFLFIPGFFKKLESDGIEYEKSVRRIVFYKFITNDKWRTAVVLIGCLIFHILVIAPYQVYKKTRDELPKVEAKNVVRQWQPPKLENRFGKVIVNYGQSQGVFEITNLTNSVKFEVNNSPYAGQFQGHHPMTVRVLNNRLYINLTIPTATKPVQFESGEIIDLPENWQWNSNSNALEIVNGEAIPVFQEFYQYPNTFTIKGAVRSGDKVFTVDRFNNQLVQFGDFEAFLGGAFESERLSQYFSYPASKYPGVLFNK